MFPLRDDEVIVFFNFTSLFTNIPIIDVNNYDQFTKKTAIPQDNLLDLVNLVLTTIWCTFGSKFCQQLMEFQLQVQHLQP